MQQQLQDQLVRYLEVSDTTQVTAALEAATLRRSSGTSGLPCSGNNQHAVTMVSAHASDHLQLFSAAMSKRHRKTQRDAPVETQSVSHTEPLEGWCA